VEIQEELDDFECLKALREAKAKTTSLNQVKKDLNIK